MSKPETIRTLALTDGEREQVRDGLSDLVYPWRTDPTPWVLEAQLEVENTIPARLREAVIAARRSPQAPSVIIVQNLPVDAVLPATPADGRRSPDKHSHVTESLLAGVGSMLGDPFSFDVEKGDELIHDVVPVRGKQGSLSNQGSETPLGFHTENAALDYPQSYLVLLGLRSDHEGRAFTPVCDLKQALRYVSNEQAEILRRPLYRKRLPLIFAEGGVKVDLTEPRPVIYGEGADLEVRAALYGNLVEPVTTESAEALQAFNQACRRAAHFLRITPGTMVIISNRRALHARSNFTPRFDGKDRWLQRVHVTDTLWPFRAYQQRSDLILKYA